MFLFGNGLSSAGVSLRVLLSAWAEPELTWHSVVYGEQADDMDIIATTHEFAEGFQTLQVHEGIGPVARLIGDLFPIREYRLDEIVAEKIGISYSVGPRPEDRSRNAAYPKELPQGVRYLIYSHDECFTDMFPANELLLNRTLAQVLKLHGFYLQHDFDWSLIVDPVLDLLKEYHAIRLRSHLARGRYTSIVNIGLPKDNWKVANKDMLHTEPHFELVWRVKFEGNIAQMEKIEAQR